jgi:DNA topoisomerase I
MAVSTTKGSSNGATGGAESARTAGLRYVSDSQPGIKRRRAGKGFAYLDADGKRIDEETLARIKRLAIPPAWTDVWICTSRSGHLQATGRDARGRKQYKYHALYRETRDENKYGRLIEFAHKLPAIRRQVDRDLRRHGLPREKVLAAVVRLLEMTLIRVGNEEYARSNNSFGLTTMRDRHVEVGGSKVFFQFRGKGGRQHKVALSDRRLAEVVRRCRDLPGKELFQYLDDDGVTQSIDSGDVNDYLREISGEDFTAKDFRTWAGTVLAAVALAEAGQASSEREARRNIVRAVERVATRLGNTPAVCRAGYVHPRLLHAYRDGVTIGTRRPGIVRAIGSDGAALDRDERLVLDWLQRRPARVTSRAA